MKTQIITRNAILILGLLLSAQTFAQLSPGSILETGDVIKNDFLVNDDTYGDMLHHEPVQMAMNDNGAYVVVWRDERNGDFDVFFQRYDALGVKQGNNTRVNDDAGEFRQDDPAVGIDENGNFVVAWGDKRNGYFDLYMQHFLADGTPQGPNVMVNDDQDDNDHFNSTPGIGMGVNGDFVVAWNDTRDDGDYDIWAQKYSANGTSEGVNFKVNSDGETNWGLVPPDAGMDQNGNFVICWDDNRYDGVSNIMAQRYNLNGTPQGPNFFINDTLEVWSSPKRRPRMAMKKNGEFVVGWEDYRSFEFPDIYAQQFDASGAPAGLNFLVTEDVVNRNPSDLNVAINETGNMVFTWSDTYDDFFGDAFAQKYDASGNADGANFKIDDAEGLGIQIYPCVGIDGDNDIVFAYCEDRGDQSITGIRYNWDGSVSGSSFTINDDLAANLQDFPVIDMNATGEFVLTWMDSRDDFGNDIFFQRYDASGNLLGSNVKVNDDGLPYARNWWPDVGIADNGSFTICWFDARNNDYPDIYAQRYTEDGTPLGINFMVNDDGSGAYQSSPIIASDAVGNFVIVWEDDRDDDDIYAQRYAADGTALGENFMVNDHNNHNQNMPNIAMNSSGTFVVIWADERVYPRRIFAQIFNPDGTRKGGNINCSELSEWRYQDQSAVDIDDDGNFVVAWEDERHSTTEYGDEDIYARMFDADGNPKGPEFRVNDNDNISDQVLPSVTMAPEGGRCLIGWTDFRKENGDPDFMAQLYVADEPDGINVMINTPDWFPSMHQKTSLHSLASSNNTVGYVWLDNRRHRNWDVYGKLTDWGLVGLHEENGAIDYVLHPNPCSDMVQIRYQIPDTRYQLSNIYSISGKKIRELMNGVKMPGEYEMTVDVSDIAAGVYFIQFVSGGQVVTKKLIIN